MEPESTSGVTGTERMRRTEELFHRAMDLPEAKRAAAVSAWSEGDEALRNDVLQLLAAEVAVEEAMASAAPLPLSGEEAWDGRVIGGYRLLRMLGRGGMGVVYLAEEQGDREKGLGKRENLSAQVAIKFVRRSLRGSPAVQHFLLERDALAALQHPNIARLLDAGVAEGLSGEAVPYVVMEYIAGLRLDEVCDAPETDTRRVVELMLQLCDAVGFAHRNLVLHRDLKPGNALVSNDGQVKLLDFGTLKMLAAEEEQSAMTQAGMRPVTLRYAAPEHVLRSAATAARVSTATDVYSLGVVLYRLLAGRLPPELEDNGTLDWFERLKQGNVTPPSRVAKRLLPSELAGDLDAVALKAMRYEPEARYASVQALADDLRRALAGQTVSARGESTRYKLGKWYGRNKALAWAGVAAAIVLLAGLLAMRHETGIALAQERVARAGVEQERRLAHTLLFDYFDQLRALPGSTDAQKRAVTEAVTYLNGLSEAQERNARTESTRELQMDQVQGYASMGAVLGSPYENNLGQADAALTVLEKGVILAGQLGERYPNDTDVLRAKANVNQGLANVYIGQSRMKDALNAQAEASAASERLVAQASAESTDFSVAATAHDAMGDLLSGHDGSVSFEPERAAQSYKQALEFDHRALLLQPASFRARRGVAVELHKLGLLQEETDPISSAAAHQKALDWLNAFSPEERARPAVSRLYYAIEQHVGLLDVRLGKTAEGIARMEDVVVRYRAVHEADRVNDQALFDLADVEVNLGEAYQLAEMREKAVSSYSAGAEDLATLAKHDPKNANWGYRAALVRYRQATATGGAGAAQQRAAMAEMVAFAKRTDFNTPDLPDVLQAMHAMGADARQALAFAQKLAGSAPDLNSEGLTACAQAAEAAGDHKQAKEWAKRALDELRKENVATSVQRQDVAIDMAIQR